MRRPNVLPHGPHVPPRQALAAHRAVLDGPRRPPVHLRVALVTQHAGLVLEAAAAQPAGVAVHVAVHLLLMPRKKEKDR